MLDGMSIPASFTMYGTSTTYEVETPVFEGPLDLLLRLIEKEELDITKVALAKVTNAFLEHVEQMRQNNQIEVVADFLSVAARLVWIKSHVLLPAPPSIAKEVDHEEDIGDELVRQLRAYRQYKEAAHWLRQRDHEDLRSYIHVGKLPRAQNMTLNLSDVTLLALQEAAQEVLYPSDLPEPQASIQLPRITIRQQIRLIRSRLSNWAKTTYRKLLSKDPSRVEAVVTLQAILELIKQHAVEAYQEELFGDIAVELRIDPSQILLPEERSEDVASQTSI